MGQIGNLSRRPIRVFVLSFVDGHDGHAAGQIGNLSHRPAAHEVNDLADAQERAKAWARQSTVERDQAVAAFKNWLVQQIVIARVALKGKKRWLELLGLR